MTYTNTYADVMCNTKHMLLYEYVSRITYTNRCILIPMFYVCHIQAQYCRPCPRHRLEPTYAAEKPKLLYICIVYMRYGYIHVYKIYIRRAYQ